MFFVSTRNAQAKPRKIRTEQIISVIYKSLKTQNRKINDNRLKAAPLDENCRGSILGRNLRGGSMK